MGPVPNVVAEKKLIGRYLEHQTSYVTVIKMASSVDLDLVK